MLTPCSLTITLSLLASLSLLFFQRKQNEELRHEINNHLQQAQSTLVAASPKTDSQKMLRQQFAKENVELASQKIQNILLDAAPDSNPQLFMLRSLPKFLSIIENFDSKELLLLRKDLKTALTSGTVTFPGVQELIDMALLGLALDQNPHALLTVDPRGKPLDFHTQMIFSSLTRADPDAAINWLETADLSDSDQINLKERLVEQLLMEDSDGAILALKKFGLPKPSYIGPMASSFTPLSEQNLSRLEEAYALEANADIRPDLSRAIIGALMTKDILIAREKAATLNLTREELQPIFDHAIGIAELDTPALVDWLVEFEQDLEMKSFSSIMMASQTWAMHHLKATENWINLMEASPIKDHAIAGFAHGVYDQDPAAAYEWIEQINAPKIKEGVLTRMRRFEDYLKKSKKE